MSAFTVIFIYFLKKIKNYIFFHNLRVQPFSTKKILMIALLSNEFVMYNSNLIKVKT